ncbi:MAG TPA: chromosome segregation protein SMC [Dehalococcoidia bacterium]|nr:chromosome segregation protein SMC [Dehalococcoidia bacterium]
MFLRRLEISGFKSFASRTVFEFGPGVTAVVGPNGSGKSNIVEALRWALGESSSRVLRARKLEEVIFVGSRSRPPADKAEVTIVLDGLDGRDGRGQVSISRRAYRWGESDYLVNGRRARHRDVQELLLRLTGSTAASYAFIGQGLVESFLQMRPEDRRQLIEEASDVQRYRLRLEEASSRLSRARESMEKVRLLLGEIGPRLAQLERQARRAQEQRRLSAELSQALATWYAHAWHRARSALEEASRRLSQAQHEETVLRQESSRCAEELSRAAEEAKALRARAQAVAEERARRREAVQRLEQEAALAQQRATMLAARGGDLEEELRALREEMSSLPPVDDEEGRRESLQEFMASLERELAKAQDDLRRAEEEWRELSEAARAARQRAEALRASAQEAERRAQRLRSGTGDGNRHLQSLLEQRRSLVRRMAQAAHALRELARQEEAVLRQSEALSQEAGHLEREARQVSAQVQQVESNQAARRAQLEEMRSRLQFVQDLERQLRPPLPEEEAGGAVPGLETVLYRVLKVPKGLERAIEAVLGEWLRALVVARSDDALTAARRIADSSGERTYLVPMDGLRPVHALSLSRERGVVGVAAQLVKCDPRYRRLVDALLGRVIVVEDVETAQRMARRELGTVVTLDGLVFHPWGAIGAGQGQHTRQFTLRLEWDSEDVVKEVQRLNALIDVGERELARLRSHLQERSDALAALRRQSAALEGERRRLQEAAAQHRARLAQLKGEMRGIMASLARLREQEAASLQEAQSLAERAAALHQEAREAEAIAAHLQPSLEAAARRRRQASAAVGDLSARLASLQGELRALDEEAQRRWQVRLRLEERIRTKEEQLARLWQEEQQAAAALADCQRRLEEARRQLLALPDEGPPGEAISRAEAREQEARKRLLEVQERLIAAERALAQAEADLRRWQSEVESLAQKARSDGYDPDALPAPPSDELPEGLEAHIERLRAQLRRLGSVNSEAEAEYAQLRQRHESLVAQLSDLEAAEVAVGRAMEEMDRFLQRRFHETFEAVARGFSRYFASFFPGGEARLRLTDGPEAGVEMMARPPGKRVRTLNQLSGGERALTALAFLFALLEVNPFPFCVLDEADAMLDEANVGRFADGLRELSRHIQFIVVTHNRRTIEAADAVYGISMGTDGASRVISLRLSDVAVG